MRHDMRSFAVLMWLLGLWIGGSLVLGAVVGYNFAGMETLFERNPELAARAGFDVHDPAQKKTSLLWVHSSELNRLFFEVWNQVQLALGVLTLILALLVRSGRAVTGLLLLALGLLAYVSFVANPQLVELGRALDFVPRDPPPDGMAPFQRLHQISSALLFVQWLCLLAASAVLTWRRP